MQGNPAIQEPAAGPSSVPPTRTGSPQVEGGHTLRRPASHGRLAKLMVPGRSRSGSSASQAETPVTAFADEHGSISGRTTPEQRWRSGKAATASLLANDAKYKKFAQQVDKSLQAFESVNEWADFISFLSRLLKTLQGPHPPYAEIPKKLIVAKRLAQCLNPALPSGVHQRALDVYAHIFATIGTEGLRRDLLIWSSGIFPFFQFAATSIRPILLKIYETYYLPLADDLRPVTKAIILALLPGLEEETGDFFDIVLAILTRISDSVGATFFLQNIFLILISSPHSRLSALNYLSRKFLKPPADKIDTGLVVRGVAAVLEDENSLVRRGGLDLLLRTLPLDADLLADAEERDRNSLMRGVSGVVLQREISLSRRVYTWLLGTDETSEGQTAYFTQHGLDLLSSVLQYDMENAAYAESGEDQRSFKVFLSLLDKWEVGSALSERLAIPALEAIKRAVETFPSIREEFIMTASAVYDAVEPVIIWKAFSDVLDQPRDDHLLRWTLLNLPQKDEEVVGYHIPVLLEHVLHSVTRDPRMLPDDQLSSSQSRIDLAELLFRHIEPNLFNLDPAESLPGFSQGAVNGSTATHSETNTVMPSIVKNVFALTINKHISGAERTVVLDMACKMIESDYALLSQVDEIVWLDELVQQLVQTTSFDIVDGIMSTMLKASQCSVLRLAPSIFQPWHIRAVLDSLFGFLRPDSAPYHSRVVDLLWGFNRLAEIHTLENVIATQMLTNLSRARLASMEAFGTLWRLTEDAMLPGEIFHVPILLILESLRNEDPEIKGAAETWMRCNLKSYFRILDPLLVRMLDPAQGDVAARGFDCNAAVAHMRSVDTLFKSGGQALSKLCQVTEITTSLHPTLPLKAKLSLTYLDLILDILLSHLRLSPAKTKDRVGIMRLQATVLDVLEMLVTSGQLKKSSIRQLKSALLDQLSISTRASSTILHHQLLRLLQYTITSGHTTHRRQSSITAESQPDEEDEQRLCQVFIEGISSSKNRPVLQHWVDFVLIVAPTIRRLSLVHALCDAVSLQLRSMALEIDLQNESPRGVTDVHVIMLLSASERLLSLSSPAHTGRKSEDGRVAAEGGSGILGLMSGVFISETSEDKPKAHDLEYLVIALEALLFLWTVTARSSSRMTMPIAARNRQVLQKMYKTQTGAVVAGCISIWASTRDETRDGVDDDAIFGSIDALTPSAQRVIEIVSDSIKQSRTVETSDATMLFLEAYVSRLEAPIAVQIWSTMFSFARELLASASTPMARAQLYPLLRCLTVLSRIVITTSALEDRRLRRDLQDVYPKILDAIASNMLKVERKDEKEKIYNSVIEAIPSLRAFLLDQDKVAAACSSIWLGIVNPALKQYRATPDVLRIVLELSKIPSAAKTWRPAVGDAFNDIRFFGTSLEEVSLWKPIICSLFDSDKERFNELLSRITAAPSANIFTNREQEMISRSSNLRRLSFVLLAADQNHHLTQLPAIQEKLVEILRTNVVSPRVHSEVYLCLRVIMCRISAQHLTNFWPVILAELLRVFEGIMEEIPVDGSESLQLALAACKFLDLLLVIQSEDFQIHQWMFVTDTTDAAFPPEDFSAEAIMDTIADILREHSHSVTGDAPTLELDESSHFRRPRLARVKAINSIRQLEPFFSRASIDTFEGVYRNAGVDWTAVEDGLSEEIFS